MTVRSPFGGLSIFWQTLLLIVATLVLSQLVSATLLISLPPPRPDYNSLSDIADTLAGRRFDPAEQNNTDDSDRSLILASALEPPQPSVGMTQDRDMTRHFAQHVGVAPERVRLFYEADQQPGFPFSFSQARDVVPMRRNEPVFYNSVVGALDTGHGWRVVRTEAPKAFDDWQLTSLIGFAISLLLLLPLGWFFARRLANPIRRFADAAEQLGQNPNAPPVDVGGPAELRTTGEALNRMQARISAYLRERTMMIGAIAHDLRTPLARIAFRIEDAPDTIREPVQADVEQMRAMIASTINFIQGASSHFERIPLDLTGLLRRLVEQQTATGGLVSFDDAVPATVSGDRVALNRLFQNLIDNAELYAGRAEIAMRRDRQHVSVTVSDRGPGLSDDMLTSALEPFVRNDPSRNRATGGVGLGLTIARSIAADHGGILTLHSREGGGLCAQVKLPLFLGRQR